MATRIFSSNIRSLGQFLNFKLQNAKISGVCCTSPCLRSIPLRCQPQFMNPANLIRQSKTLLPLDMFKQLLSRDYSAMCAKLTTNKILTNSTFLHPRPLIQYEPCMQKTTNLFVLHRKKRKYRRKKPTALDGCPQKRGIVLKTLIKKPKKPNSANRKCVLVRLSNGKEITAFVPGEGHSLQEHNAVLVELHRTKDVPGLKYRVIRGVYDCAHVVKKTQSVK